MRSARGSLLGLAVLAIACSSASSAGAAVYRWPYDLTVSATGTGSDFRSDHSTYYETASNNSASSHWSITYPVVIALNTGAGTIELQTPNGPTNGYLPSSSTTGTASYSGTISCDVNSPCSASPNHSPYTCTYSNVDLSKYMSGGVLQPAWGYGPDHASYESQSISFRATAGFQGGGPPLYCSDPNHGATPTPASAMMLDSGSGGCGAQITMPLPREQLGDPHIVYRPAPVTDGHCAGPADFGFTGTIAYTVRLDWRGPLLAPDSVVVKGWRSTGNLQWMMDGGPPGAATPQSTFEDDEAIQVTVTVRNRGTEESLGVGDVASVAAQIDGPTHPPGGDYIFALEPPIPPLRPGESEAIIRNRPLTSKFLGRFRLAAKAFSASEYDYPFRAYSGWFTVVASPATYQAPTISSSPSGLDVQGRIGPPNLPPAELGTPPPRVRSLDVGILELNGAAQVMRVRPATCSWVASPSGRVARRQATGGVCSKPIWLPAQLRGRRWSFKLRGRLPRGRYIMYVRALDSHGLYDPVFSAAKHNRIAFKVR